MVVLKRGVNRWLFLITVVAMTAGVVKERISTNHLRARLTALRDQRGELESLRRDQGRLRALQQAGEEREWLEADAVEREESAHLQPEQLTSGKWLPPDAWKYRGCATPASTLESMLWAAASGETAALADMLHFDDPVRAKLEQIFARLPTDYRLRYVSPAQLMGAFTTEAIPIGNARLISEQQSGPDEAEAGVWITVPDYRPLDSPSARTSPSINDLVGPTWRRGQRNRANFSLRRIDGAWRLIVPLSAVMKIEKEIGGLK